MPKILFSLLLMAIGVFIQGCGTSKNSHFGLNNSSYIIEKVERNTGSIDPSVSYFYVEDFNSLANSDNYINLIFDCDLQIASCCRDLDKNEQGKDLKVDISFSNNPEKCLSPDILTKQKSISIKNDKKTQLNIFKVKSDHCKCSGGYTSLSKHYKDSVFVLPYNLDFLEFGKDEIKEVKQKLN